MKPYKIICMVKETEKGDILWIGKRSYMRWMFNRTKKMYALIPTRPLGRCQSGGRVWAGSSDLVEVWRPRSFGNM